MVVTVAYNGCYHGEGECTLYATSTPGGVLRRMMILTTCANTTNTATAVDRHGHGHGTNQHEYYLRYIKKFNIGRVMIRNMDDYAGHQVVCSYHNYPTTSFTTVDSYDMMVV